MTGARSYKTLALFGLITTIWFAALAKGAHDLWASTFLFSWLSLITLIYLTGSYKAKDRIAIPLASCFLLILFDFLISSRYSFDLNTTHLEMWVWFFSIIAFFLFNNIFRDPALRIQFITLAGLVLLPVTLVAAAQYGRDLPAFFHSHWAAESTFTNSAVLAGFALSWAMTFWHLRKKSLVHRWLFIGSMVTLLLARSWWAYISLLFGFTFYYQERIKSTFKSRRLASIGLCFFALGLLILTYLYKFGSWQEPIYRATNRLNWWAAGFRMAKEHPWTGVGLGSYGTAFLYYRTPTVLNTLFAHSFPVQILSETGLLGCLGILALGIVYIRKTSMRQSMPTEFSACQATVIILLCFSLTTIFLDYFIGKLMLFMNMALVLSFMDLKTVSISRRTFWGIAIALLFISPSWYLPLRASQYYVQGLLYENQLNEPLAERSYIKALKLNPYQDESCAALARLYAHRYSQSHSLLDLSKSLFWVQRALNLKKTSTSLP